MFTNNEAHIAQWLSSKKMESATRVQILANVYVHFTLMWKRWIRLFFYHPDMADWLLYAWFGNHPKRKIEFSVGKKIDTHSDRRGFATLLLNPCMIQTWSQPPTKLTKMGNFVWARETNKQHKKKKKKKKTPLMFGCGNNTQKLLPIYPLG